MSHSIIILSPDRLKSRERCDGFYKYVVYFRKKKGDLTKNLNIKTKVMSQRTLHYHTNLKTNNERLVVKILLTTHSDFPTIIPLGIYVQLTELHRTRYRLMSPDKNLLWRGKILSPMFVFTGILDPSMTLIHGIRSDKPKPLDSLRHDPLCTGSISTPNHRNEAILLTF